MRTLPLTTKDKKSAKEWLNWNKKNQEGYGWAVIEVISKLGANLDEGLTPSEAEAKAIKGSGITGFMAGLMAQAINQLHPRGAEFNKYWNDQFGQPDAKGTINPAIIEIKPNTPNPDMVA